MQKYDFCGLKRGCCDWQMKADSKMSSMKEEIKTSRLAITVLARRIAYLDRIVNGPQAWDWKQWRSWAIEVSRD